MITQLNFKNFKSWNKTGNIKLSPITGFFGTNSSGKTSIIQLLLMLKQTAESPDRNQVLEFGSDKTYIELGTFRDIICQHDETRSLDFQLNWTLDQRLAIQDPEKKKGELLFEIEQLEFKSIIKQTEKKQLIIDSLSYQSDPQHCFKMVNKNGGKFYALEPGSSSRDKSAYKFIKNIGRQWDLPAPTKYYGFPPQIKTYYQNAAFLIDLEVELEKLFKGVFYLGPLRDYPKRQYTWSGARPADMGRKGELSVDALLASREGKRIKRGRGKASLSVEEYTAHWLKELGLIDSFVVEPVKEGGTLYQVKVRKTPGSAEVLITDVGFGVSQILPVITLCYYVPEGSTIIIEQPEIHLHPKVQAGLADVIIDAVKNRNVQVIIESHSEHLLKRLQRRIAEDSISNDSVSLYFCQTGDEYSSLTPLELDLYGNISNWPEDFFGDEMGEIAAMTKAMLERRSANK